MRLSKQFSILSISAILGLGVSVPLATFAGNGPAKPAPRAQPDEQKKVWTNDDVARLNPEFAAVAAKPAAGGSAAAAIVVVTPVGRKQAPVIVPAAAPVDPREDPAWYGAQLEDLQTELAEVEGREQQLQNFRNTASGLPTGLILNAPCTGITTDNLIANLDAERQAILAQIDALEDLARSHGLAPGALYAPEAAPPSPAQERATVKRVLQRSSAQLAEIETAVASMQDQAASLHATLQPPTPGFGGNMTTDLLERLDNRAAAAQADIDSAAEAARLLGMAPGDIR
jgi:hypothetical protein